MTDSAIDIPASDEAEEYRRVMAKMASGQPISLDDLMVHVDVQNRNVQTGPDIGSAVPEIGLPDQSGTIRTLGDLSGPNGLLLAFTRTVDWCPYCRNHAVELERSYDRIREAGLGLALVCVDDAEAVNRFLTEHAVTYPILRDDRIELVRRFGIANENIPGDAPVHSKGMPYPGNFLIDPDGRLRDKIVLEDYQFRPTSTLLVMKHFGLGMSRIAARIEASVLGAEVNLSSRELFTAQEIGLEVRVSIKPGWHVYGRPVGSGYVPFSVAIDGELFTLQGVEYPVPETMLLPAIGERLPVYHGQFVVRGRLRCRWSAPAEFDNLHGLEYLRDEAIVPGDYSVSGHIRFQGCSDQLCATPETVPFSLPVTILPEIKRPTGN